jgi:hypothetical protein
MSSDETRHWLSHFQKEFTEVLRSPLDLSSGTMRADTKKYARELSQQISTELPNAANRGLSVYNRQYWFRLFGAMHSEFPLVSRLLGYWRFNEIAMRFLGERPPQDVELHRIGRGFCAWLAKQLPAKSAIPKIALTQAAHIDEAWSRIFLAPEQPRWRPSPDDAAQLLQLKFTPTAALAIVEQKWPLLALRSQLSTYPGEGAIPLPASLAQLEHWALLRTDEGIGELLLAPRQARLYHLMGIHTLGEALATLEQECSDVPPEQLQREIASWTQQSVELGFWVKASI